MKLEDLHLETRYPAILRNLDNQPLASGEVLFYREKSEGLFFLVDLKGLRNFPMSKAILEMPQHDLKLEVLNVAICPDIVPPHIHFDLAQ
jgi:hypothetical protein